MKLSHDDRERIHTAVAQAEAKTRAHLAVTIVPASDHYALYPLLWGALAALLTGAVLALVRPELSVRLATIVEISTFAVVALALGPFVVRLRAVPAVVKRDKTRALAQREFAARILSPARDGILIFASLGERHAELLATHAVHVAVGDAAWAEIVSRFTAQAARGDVAGGTIAAVEACAAHLATHFPNAAS
jgi:putative membrane protein